MMVIIIPLPRVDTADVLGNWLEQWSADVDRLYLLFLL